MVVFSVTLHTDSIAWQLVYVAGKFVYVSLRTFFFAANYISLQRSFLLNKNEGERNFSVIGFPDTSQYLSIMHHIKHL